MRKLVNKELKTLMPLNLNEIQQKLWRVCFNVKRQNDLAQENPSEGMIISNLCIEYLKQSNPEDFPS